MSVTRHCRRISSQFRGKPWPEGITALGLSLQPGEGWVGRGGGGGEGGGRATFSGSG